MFGGQSWLLQGLARNFKFGELEPRITLMTRKGEGGAGADRYWWKCRQTKSGERCEMAGLFEVRKPKFRMQNWPGLPRNTPNARKAGKVSGLTSAATLRVFMAQWSFQFFGPCATGRLGV